MKTSEFRSKVEEMGYSTITTNYRLRIYSNDMIAASIMLDRERVLIIDSSRFDFIKLCIEYAETPIEEREDEKKYIVILPDPLRRGRKMMALGRLEENKNEIIIQHVKLETLTSERCILTESEIKRNHEYLWQFAKEVKE